MYINAPLKDYLDDLAAKLPAPGGGSVAALTAATGVSLMSMVANYTATNPKYKAVSEAMSGLLASTGRAKASLERFIDADIEVFNRVSKAMKELAKDSPELEAAYKDAASVPFEICKICAEMLGLCRELARSGNKNLVTDTAIAVILLEGAFFSAKYNVYINLKYIKDMGYIENIHEVLAPYEESLPKLKDEILEMCEEVIER